MRGPLSRELIYLALRRVASEAHPEAHAARAGICTGPSARAVYGCIGTYKPSYTRSATGLYFIWVSLEMYIVQSRVMLAVKISI